MRLLTGHAETATCSPLRRRSDRSPAAHDRWREYGVTLTGLLALEVQMASRTETAIDRPSTYERFQILVDDPAEDPRLGFREYADAFAQIVCGSPPRFAVGIFGNWGSGKTTLMRAIMARIEGRDDVIPVWFNAWRYEREQELIVPLLDVLREALLNWAADEAPARPARVRDRARVAAAALGKAARAIAAGVTLSARTPGGFIEAKIEGERIVAAASEKRDKGEKGETDDDPVSLYHASFVSMAESVRGFVTAGGRRRRGEDHPLPQRRIVVFVDDLDRCLPLNALSVLESMKLFFDLEGFVFVAGLDQQVIERAIEIKYADPRDGAAITGRTPKDETGAEAPHEQRRGNGAGTITGRDYVKKIFQVPFGLPPIDRSLLDQLVDQLVEGTSLATPQRRELKGRVLKHLAYFSDETGVNPREVKRLINAYTLQLKLLSLRLGDVDCDSILALQIMAFRPDWERIWRRLEADPDGFMERLEQGLANATQTDIVWVDGEPLPPRFVDYISDGPAKPLRTNRRLAAYLSSSQASHSSDPTILKAQADADAIKRLVHRVNETDRAQLSAAIHEKLAPLKSSILSTPWGSSLVGLISRLEEDASALAAVDADVEPPRIDEWTHRFRARLDRLDNDLRDMRERYSLRPT